jgi:hypothetical protein
VCVLAGERRISSTGYREKIKEKRRENKRKRRHLSNTMRIS